jgi:hypothetical protein
VSLGRGGGGLVHELAVEVAELRSGGNNILGSTGTDSKPGGSGTGIPSLVMVAALSSMSTLLERLVIGKQVAPVRIPFETLLLIGSWLPLLRGIAADMLTLVIKKAERNSWVQTFHLGDASRTRPVHVSLRLAEFDELPGFLSRDENSDTGAPHGGRGNRPSPARCACA